MSTEDVEVYTGKTNLIEDLDLHKQISLEAVPEGSDGNVPFVTTVVKLPAMTGINCVGIRLCSPIPELMNPAEPYSRNPSYFEITNFSVSEAVPDGITSAADAIRAYLSVATPSISMASLTRPCSMMPPAAWCKL